MNLKFVKLFIYMGLFLLLTYYYFFINEQQEKVEIIWKDKTTNSTFQPFRKRFALFSSTLDDNYTFNIPVVIHAWRRLNIEPIVVIVMDDNKFKYNENSSSGQILNYLARTNVKTFYIKADAKFSIVIAQVIRLFIGIISDHVINDDDYVMTTDSDLAPLSLSYYNVDMSRIETTITIWNAYCCGYFRVFRMFPFYRSYRMFPMGHIGMTKKTWRNVMKLNETKFNFDGDSVLKWLLEIYGDGFKQGDEKSAFSWTIDQRLVSVFVDEYQASNKASLDLRPYTGTRLDRVYDETEWDRMLNDNSLKTDSHLFQSQTVTSIKIFQTFLSRFFINETKLMNFYQELIFKYWKF